jgi:hypothetical protein
VLQILPNVVHIYLQELTVKKTTGLLASQIISDAATNSAETSTLVQTYELNMKLQ